MQRRPTQIINAMTLTLHIDTFFCGKARRAIQNRAVLQETLEHTFADEYCFISDSESDCINLKAIIEDQFADYEIPADEYEISII